MATKTNRRPISNHNARMGKVASQFGSIRGHRLKVVETLGSKIGKPMSREALAKAVYGSAKHASTLTHVLDGVEARIVDGKLPFTLYREGRGGSEKVALLKGRGRKSA